MTSRRLWKPALGLMTAGALLLAVAPVYAVPPANDLCAGAEALAGAGPFPFTSALTADITDATAAGDPPAPSCTGGPVLRSVWYTFTPTASGQYSISTCADAPAGTTVNDTVLGLYTSAAGCGGPFTEVGCDDDGCVYENLQSVVTANLTAGTQYFVVVWKFETVAPAVGSTAVQLRVSPVGAPANDTCAGATALQLDRSTLGTLAGSQDDYRVSDLACFAGTGQLFAAGVGGEVVYSFTAPAAATYSFKVWNLFDDPDALLYVGSSCPAATPGTPVTVACARAANRAPSAEEIACVQLAAGQQVFAFVDQTAASAGAPFYVQVETCAVKESASANDTPATAGSAACTLEASLTPGTDTDFFSLGPVPVDSRVFAVLDTSASASNDADLRVTTATDTLEYDDDGNDLPWGEFGPNVAGTKATGAQLFLRASNFDTGSPTDPYRLYTTVQPAIGLATAESEPNDSIANADSAVNQYFAGALTGGPPSTDLDLYRFSARAGDLVYLGLDGDPLRNNTPIDALITLRDAAGAILLAAADSSFTAGTSNTTASPGTLIGITPFSPGEALVFRAPSTGDYFAGIERDPNSSGTGDYLLSISSNCGPEGRLHTLPPCRAVDTRNADGPLGGPTLAHEVARTFNLMGACGIPPGATGLTLNVTAVGPTGGGQVKLYPGDLVSPTNTTVVAFNTGNTRAAMLVVALAADGTLKVMPTVAGSGEVDLLIDVTGYFD